MHASESGIVSDPGPEGCMARTPDPQSFAALSEAKRSAALERFHVLRPFLEDEVSLSRIAREQGIRLRTAQRWVRSYRKEGLAGLARKGREDKEQPRRAPSLRPVIEGLALTKPRLSAAAIHRRAVEAAIKLGEEPPSYSTVYAHLRRMNPALLTMAHG